jgi:transcriptional regulator with XRE-family HTH domain
MHGSLHKIEYGKFLRALRKARENRGLTQAEAAKLLNRPQSYISKCESGERRVDIIELMEFAKLYEVSLNFFTNR